MTNRKDSHHKERKDTIKCECGDEILILPDVKATGESIECHVALHTKGAKGPACTTLEAERLRDVLIVQVLKIAGEPKDEKKQK